MCPRWARRSLIVLYLCVIIHLYAVPFRQTHCVYYNFIVCISAHDEEEAFKMYNTHSRGARLGKLTQNPQRLFSLKLPLLLLRAASQKRWVTARTLFHICSLKCFVSANQAEDTAVANYLSQRHSHNRHRQMEKRLCKQFKSSDPITEGLKLFLWHSGGLKTETGSP